MALLLLLLDETEQPNRKQSHARLDTQVNQLVVTQIGSLLAVFYDAAAVNEVRCRAERGSMWVLHIVLRSGVRQHCIYYIYIWTKGIQPTPILGES